MFDPKIMLMARSSGLLLSTLLVAAVSSRAAIGQTDRLAPEAIADAVEDELVYAPAVDCNGIDITVREGTVVLAGEVDNLLAERRAVRIAETVRGVRSVVDRLNVTAASGLSDDEILSSVDNRLLRDPATESFEVDVSVDEGVVTLEGTVESWRERSLCETVAAGAIGVRKIENRLDLDLSEPRPDTELLHEIEESLRWDTLVDHALITVEVENGDATLRGNVGSAAEKWRAREDAMVRGVRSVDVGDLEVADWARNPERRTGKYTSLKSEDIEKAVNRAMLYDPRVDSFAVTVERRNDGEVTLRGQVPTLAQKRAASRCARHTVGVRAVDNRLRVRSEVDTSEVTERALDRALVEDPFLEASEIEADVIDGKAYLEGTVDNFFEKGRAELAAESILGIVSIENRLDVLRPDPSSISPYVPGLQVFTPVWYRPEPALSAMSDAEIRSDIEREIWWSPFLDSEDVDVVVEDGEAILTGTVDSWAEVRDATENAYEGGAVWVRNRLEVQRPSYDDQ
jgi:osmotically-inducible protein OsmY